MWTSGIGTSDVQHINMHATATPLGDVAETRAIRNVFGDRAESLSLVSTKSMTGHLLGAAGAVEGILSILSVANDAIAPTINLDKPGEGCDLDYVPNTARQTPVRAALSNSFGFGGTNGTVIFSKV